MPRSVSIGLHQCTLQQPHLYVAAAAAGKNRGRIGFFKHLKLEYQRLLPWMQPVAAQLSTMVARALHNPKHTRRRPSSCTAHLRCLQPACSRPLACRDTSHVLASLHPVMHLAALPCRCVYGEAADHAGRPDTHPALLANAAAQGPSRCDSCMPWSVLYTFFTQQTLTIYLPVECCSLIHITSHAARVSGQVTVVPLGDAAAAVLLHCGQMAP